jgi:hypothetical protein
MPNKKLTYEISADTSKAARDIKQLGDAGKDAGDDIESGLGGGFEEAESAGTKALSTLSSKLDGLESDVKGTASAVKAIGANLGDGFDSSRIEAMVGDLRKMGVTFDEIEAKAKEFADVIQRVDGIKLDAVNSGLTGVGTSLDKVGSSADQSRSVMANLAGNAAQDLGELGGVVGTLGVGIGQLAEYAVDGNIKLSNLAKVAGPMAGLAAATALVTQAIGAIKAENAFNTAMVDDFTDALREGETVAGHLRDTVLETGNLDFATGLFGGGGFLGIGSEVRDLIPLFTELGLNYDDFIRLLADPTGVDQLNAMKDTWLELALATDNENLADIWTGHAEAARDAADGLEAYKENTDNAVISQEELAEFTAGTDAEVKKLDQSLKTAVPDIEATTEAAADAAEQLAAFEEAAAGAAITMNSAEYGTAGIEEAGDALREFLDTARFGINDELIENAAALDDAFASIAEHGLLTGVATPEARAQIETIRKLADTYVPRVQTAFENADGSLSDFRAEMGRVGTGIHTQLVQQFMELGQSFDEASDNANTLMVEMGYIPENVTTMYMLMGIEEAKAQLALLGPYIDALTQPVQMRIGAAVAHGDFIQARIIAERSLGGQLLIPVHANTGPFIKDVDNLRYNMKYATPIAIPAKMALTGGVPTGGNYNYSGGRPTMAATATQTDAAPAGYYSTSTATPVGGNRTTNVNIAVNAAMVGNRYEVQRMLRGSVRELERLGQL